MNNPPTESVAEITPQKEIPKKDLKNRPRTTIVETLVYHRPGEEPTNVTNRFAFYGESLEQEYKRQIRVGEVWVPIDTGWLNNRVSTLILVNELIRPSKNISQEEEELINSKVLEIGIISIPEEENPKSRTMFSPPKVQPSLAVFSFLPPGEAIRLRPENIASYRIRCRNDSTKVTIHCYPE